MATIKRAKGGATHYATAVREDGAVTGWDADPAAAADVPALAAHKVKTAYAKRTDAGKLTVEAARPRPGEAPRPTVEIPADELDRLTAEAREATAGRDDVKARCETAEAKVKELTAQLADRKAEADKAGTQWADWSSEAVAQKDRADALAAELEAAKADRAEAVRLAEAKGEELKKAVADRDAALEPAKADGAKEPKGHHRR